MKTFQLQTIVLPEDHATEADGDSGPEDHDGDIDNWQSVEKSAAVETDATVKV